MSQIAARTAVDSSDQDILLRDQRAIVRMIRRSLAHCHHFCGIIVESLVISVTYRDEAMHKVVPQRKKSMISVIYKLVLDIWSEV